MVAIRRYAGAAEAMRQSEDWLEVGSWRDEGEGGLEWVVFEKPQPHDPSWSTVKVVANGLALKKANYWFTHQDGGKTGFAKDLRLMAEGRPWLYRYLRGVFSGL